jgi:ketosteroid isomerase-like protein
MTESSAGSCILREDPEQKRMTRTWMARTRVLAALGFALAVAATDRAGTAAQAKPDADVVAAETRRYFDAVRRNDAATLESLFAADYLEVSPLGQVDKRAQVIGFYKTAARAQSGQASELAAVALDDLSVRVFGDVVVVVVRESFTLQDAGTPVVRPIRSTLVWRRMGGTWWLVSSHHTAIRPPIDAGSPDGR